MSARPFVILYVEDNELIRLLFAEPLEKPGRLVVYAGDGAGARAAMREHDVDLLMIDVDLPDGSGLDVAREALQQNPALPVIVCSGHDLRDVPRLLGPTAHPLSKPVDLHELDALLERLVR